MADDRDGAKGAAAGEVYHAVVPYWWADDSEHVLEFAMHPIRDEAGQVAFLHPTGIDVTKRMRTEEALRRSEERLRLATSAARLGLHEFDPRANTVVRAHHGRGRE